MMSCIFLSTAGRARSISRSHRGSRARTVSTPSVSSTAVTRASAGPTASCQANDVRSFDAGWRRMISTSTPVAKLWMGIMGTQGVYHSTRDTFLPEDALKGERGGGSAIECRLHAASYDGWMSLILASASPRRSELLASAGFTFETMPSDVDETPRDGEAAADYAVRVARDKAELAFARCRNSGSVVLAADTVVVAEGRILGKPADDGEAATMLKTLSGRVHDVHTGVVARTGSRELAEVVTTRVRLLPLSDKEIAWYIASGEPQGKAGGYAIQGRAARFIDWIDGSWSNVVGLPIATVYRLLKGAGEVLF